MNKIYRVIWSHVKHCYVVVSELAKAHHRPGTIRTGRISIAALAVVTLLGSTSFAAGSEDTEAVNVAQLNAAYAKAIEASSEAAKHTTVSVKDDNIIINTMTNEDGSTNYDVALNPVVTVDEVTAEKGTIGGLTIADNSLTKGTTKVVLGGDASQGTGITNGQASLILQDKTVTLTGATGVDGDVSVHGNVTAKTASLGDVKFDSGIASGTDFTTTYKGQSVSLNDVYNRTSQIKRTDDYTTLIGDTVAVRAVGGTHKGGLFLKGIVDGDPVTMTQFLEDGSAVIGKVGIKVDGKITGVAAGIGDTDAVNVGQLKELAAKGTYTAGNGIAIRDNVISADLGITYGKEKNTLHWGNNTEAAKINDTAWGSQTKAAGGNATAFGFQTEATGGYATAWGSGAKAAGWASTAWGMNTLAKGSYATAWGNQSVATGYAATALGLNSKAYGRNSFAALGGIVGKENESDSATNSAAIGNGATVLVRDTLALGSGSVADRDVKTYTKDGAFSPVTRDIDIPTWKGTANAIAIGDAKNGVTRQLTGLAAGSEDTDAVNVAQLKAVSADSASKTGDLQYTNAKYVAKDDDLTVAVGKLDTAVYTNHTGIQLLNQYTGIEKQLNAGGAKDLTAGVNAAYAKALAASGEAAKHTTVSTKGDNIIINTTTNEDGSTNYDVALNPVVTVDEVTTKRGTIGGVTMADGIASGTDFTTTYKGNTVSLNDVYNRTSHIKRTDDYTTIIGDTVAVRAVGGTHKGGLFLKGIVDGDPVIMTQFLEDGSAVIGKIGIKADGKITGVAAGIGDTDAVNVSQLKSYAGSAKTEVKAADGETNITVEKTTGANGQDIYSVALQKQLDLTTGGSISFGNGNSLSAAGLTIHNKTYITKDGINASGQKITNVATGTDATDAVNKGQLEKTVADATQGSVKWDEGTTDTIHGVQVSDGKVTANNGISAGNGNFNVDDKGNLNIGNGKFTVDAATGNTTVGGDLNVTGGLKVNGKDVATSESVDKINNKLGSGEFTNGKETYTDAINQNTADIKTNADNIATNTKNIGDVKQYEKAGINGTDGKAVTNVVDATISNKQAITAVDTKVGDGKLDNGTSNLTEGINQNYQAIQDNSKAIGVLGSAVNKLDTRVNRVGAGAAALAALQPLDYDPENKWDFAAGYGNYGGASAVAIGTYYRPNETTLLSLGGSFGGGENMVNAGLSVKIGAGQSGRRMARKELSQEITALREIINSQAAANEQQNAEIAALKEIIEELKQNH